MKRIKSNQDMTCDEIKKRLQEKILRLQKMKDYRTYLLTEISLRLSLDQNKHRI